MKVLQVGVGGMGMNWVRWVTENRQTRMVGMVDIREEALLKACDIGGYNEGMCYLDLRQALRETSADLLVCATPPEHHRRVSALGMRGGLDVICEKPMAHTLRDCRSMLRAARETKRTCVISQNYRYCAAAMRLADLVRSGGIGEVGQVSLDFHMGVDFRGGFRHTMPYPQLVDMAIHHFDLVRFITGLEAVSVRGEAWNPTWSNFEGDCSSSLVFRMNNGCRVTYNASWCSKGEHCDWNGDWLIEGSRGCIVYRRGEITLMDVPVLYRPERVKSVAPRKLRKEGQALVLNEYIRLRKAGVLPATDVRANFGSIAMVFAAVRAAETGNRVPVASG